MVRLKKIPKRRAIILVSAAVAVIMIMVGAAYLRNQQETKKQSLVQAYSRLSTSQDKGDWKVVYEYASKSVRANVTEAQFATFMSKDKPVYVKTTVNNVSIDGNNGTVERTIVTCATTACTGSDKTQDVAKRYFVYSDGKWQLEDPTPSTKAITTMTYLFNAGSSEEHKTFIENYSYGTNNAPFAINNAAVEYDQIPASAAAAEQLMSNIQIGQEVKQACPGFYDSQDSYSVGQTYVKNNGVPTAAGLQNLAASCLQNKQALQKMFLPGLGTKSTHCTPDYAGGMNCN